MKILYIEEEDRLKHKTKHERNNLMKGKKESIISNIVTSALLIQIGLRDMREETEKPLPWN